MVWDAIKGGESMMSYGPKESLPSKAPPIKKVFCGNCVWLNEGCYKITCAVKEDNWYGPDREPVIPEEKNKHNDCKYFKEEKE